jgi:predicted nucleic acid-binding Zn ribbon protein
MPTYVYRCPKCSREKLQTRSYDMDEELVAPECEYCHVKMVRSWNDTPVIFKGKGFYKNDSKTTDK